MTFQQIYAAERRAMMVRRLYAEDQHDSHVFCWLNYYLIKLLKLKGAVREHRASSMGG